MASQSTPLPWCALDRRPPGGVRPFATVGVHAAAFASCASAGTVTTQPSATAAVRMSLAERDMGPPVRTPRGLVTNRSLATIVPRCATFVTSGGPEDKQEPVRGAVWCVRVPENLCYVSQMRLPGHDGR